MDSYQHRPAKPAEPESIPKVELPPLDFNPSCFVSEGCPPPIRPSPGEPGFAPLVAMEGRMSDLEDRIATLEALKDLKENEGQIENIQAVIDDLRRDRTTAEFYRGGKSIRLVDFDPSKGPTWDEIPRNSQHASWAAHPRANNGNLVGFS
ncbi:uncharacterized protein DFL_006348 [Arthrobotrys flagrans]|uniref:Uncharacterized protein n=1 Tax=Arthrobotrys flagrans TaxID=97331 RepID=A0A437A024_ARTFL|nr:hypothetical protein DFL_006348 [Arthrobotrys flagrans]